MKQTKNNTFYWNANFFKWLTIIIILIPLISFTLNMINTYSVVIEQYSLITQILSIVQLMCVFFWTGLNFTIFVIAGSDKEHIKTLSTRICLLISLILTLGPSVFAILLVYNVIPTFDGINFLVISLPLIEITGLVIALVLACRAISKLRFESK